MGILEPRELLFLADVVDKHCSKHRILDRDARDSVAASAVAFYMLGMKAEADLLDALAAQDDPDRRRRLN